MEGQPGLADAGFAADRYGLTLPTDRLLPELQQLLHFPIASDELAQLELRAQRLEAALDEHLPSDAPDRHGCVEALERMQSERHALEQFPDQAASFLRDRDG